MTEEIVLEMNDDLSLRRVVFETLRKAILSGKMEPGERLLELPLARQLGVSRTPVREAIHMLQQEGLVCVVPHRGAMVTGICREDMEDLLDVRSALETLAAEKACQMADEKKTVKLEAAARAFERSCSGGSLESRAAADGQFHRAICEAGENRSLLKVMESLEDQVYRYRVEYLKEDLAVPEILRQHRRILEAIRQGDEKSAGKAVNEHIQAQKQVLLAKIRENRREERSE